ncbi:MAG: hypothetical protein ACM3X9_04070, partial [Bacillota bacterium]
MKKWFWLFLVLIVLLPAVCGAESDVPTVRVATLAGTTGLSMVYLMEQPQTSKVTYNIEVLMSPDLAVAKLIAGETDFAGLPTN